jgi:pSer/pThr/pTyr-binding forkhead associated (FHA) protein
VAVAVNTMTTAVFIPEDPLGEISDEDLQKGIGDLAEGAGVLVVKRGPDTGARHLLDNSVTKVGRHPESDIFLDDITVSRRHAEFERGDDGYHVRDVGSLNGTYVNRERIDSQRLVDSDELQVGKYKLTFRTQ